MGPREGNENNALWTSSVVFFSSKLVARMQKLVVDYWLVIDDSKTTIKNDASH